jgi:hypothetical protein
VLSAAGPRTSLRPLPHVKRIDTGKISGSPHIEADLNEHQRREHKMAPGFDPQDYEVGQRDPLSTRYPRYARLIAALTR